MRTTVTRLREMKGTRPIVMITAYDAWMASVVDDAVDAILVGDSLGIVVQGHDSTLPVTLDEIIYHCRAVARGSRKALVIADLPFLSYQASVEDAIRSGGRCLKEGGAQAVKLEGGRAVLPQVKALVEQGIPVAGHLGLTPQSIHLLGGFDEQGASDEAAREIRESAQALEEAGIFLLVLEAVPDALARSVTGSVRVPTIGIGAGPDCDGQVQIFHDLFGLGPTLAARFARRYFDAGTGMREAVMRYAEDVRQGKLAKESAG